MNKDEIEIRIPSKIPKQLKSVQGISDAMKTVIANKVAEGTVKIHNLNNQCAVSNVDEKCEMIIEILQDRSQFDRYVTMDEIKEIVESDDKYISSFIQKLMRIARERSIIVKKIKREGQTCYKI